MRAAATGDASFNRLILLAPPPTGVAGELRAGRTLFVVSEGERLRDSVRRDFESAPDPKRLEVLPGDAHAQQVFKTDQGERLTRLIVEFLTEE